MRSSMANISAFGGDIDIDANVNLDELSVTAPRLNQFKPAPNSIRYNNNGAPAFSTSDKIPELFPEYNRMKEQGSSDDTINTFLSQKYNLTRHDNAQAKQLARGGNLYLNGGSTNPLTEFNAGGSHEQNPNGGILQGTGQSGKPNLVEQGETKHDDYIFSNRLIVDSAAAIANGLPRNLGGKSFAEASKYLNKEAKERPNDPISKKALQANFSKLTALQESIKAAKEAADNPQMQNQNANMLAQGFANGGNIFSGTQPGASQMAINDKDGGVLIVESTDSVLGKYLPFDVSEIQRTSDENFMKMNNSLMKEYNILTSGSDAIPMGRYAYPGKVSEPIEEPYQYFLDENSFNGKKLVEEYNNNTYNPLFKPQPPKAGVLNQANPNQKFKTEAERKAELNRTGQFEEVEFDPKEGRRGEFIKNGRLIKN